MRKFFNEMRAPSEPVIILVPVAPGVKCRCRALQWCRRACSWFPPKEDVQSGELLLSRFRVYYPKQRQHGENWVVGCTGSSL